MRTIILGSMLALVTTLCGLPLQHAEA